MREYFLGPLVWLLYKMLTLTWRVTIIEPPSLTKSRDERTAVILAHWHGDGFALASIARRYRIATIVSQSNDGQMMNSVMRLQGAKTSRGSSTRGGAGALKGILRLMQKGYNCSFAVDAPKGPLHIAKPGVFEVSRFVNAPIYSVGMAASRFWLFEKAWDKAMMPKPFAKVFIYWVGPLPAVTRDQDPRSREIATALEDALRNARDLARKKMDDLLGPS